MSTDRDRTAGDVVPAPVQQAPVESPAPVAPVPLPVAAPAIGSLVVGHAEDRAEADADQMADAALSRLRRRELADGSGGDADAHQHGPGCDHLRRSPAPSGNPVVGYEGGALDSATSSAIESRRGAGKPLDAEVRRRMEGAFGSSFSGVRIHADDTAAKLNTAVSARAFTTGKDVFFGKGQYAPGTAAGDKVLAHELAHTLQPAGGAQRLVASTAISPQARAAIGRGVAAGTRIARWELPWRKKKEAPAPAPAKPAPAKPAAPAYTGPAGTMDNLWMEGGKPGGAGVAVGSVALGTHLGKAAGGASEALGGLLVGDSLMGLNNARKMDNDGARFDDAGMTNMAGRKAKNQGNALAGAAISTAKAGVGTAFVQSGGSAKDFVASTGNAALGTAAGALGIAAGSAQVLQGLWRGGKAVQKLCRLTWGRAKTMLSKRGQDWKSAIVSAEKFKGAVGAMKITLGALGIAAGALLIVSNPIGWGIGIAAAIAGGVYAGAKIAGKLKNTWDRRKAAEAIAQGRKSEEVLGEGIFERGVETEHGGDLEKVFERGVESEGAEEEFEEMREPRPRAKSRGEMSLPEAKEAGKLSSKRGFAGPAPKNPKTPEGQARSKAIQEANEVSRLASTNARLADELRSALQAGEADVVHKALKEFQQNPEADRAALIPGETERELHDAYLLLDSINVDLEAALSESGQDLIERKLSKVESM